MSKKHAHRSNSSIAKRQQNKTQCKKIKAHEIYLDKTQEKIDTLSIHDANYNPADEINAFYKKLNISIVPEINEMTMKDLRLFWKHLAKQGTLRCAICGQLILLGKTTSKDHVIPESFSGPTNAQNLTPTHPECNLIKTDLLPKEWQEIGLKLLAEQNIDVDFNYCMYNYKNRQK